MDDVEYEDYLYELGELKHEPMHPPRQGHIAENVFAERWKLFMATPPMRKGDLWGPMPSKILALDILSHLPARVTQRHATIAASIVTWLGTNCGLGTMETARQNIARYHMHASTAYLCAWATCNQRLVFVNHGHRTLEHLLAPADHFGRDIFSGGITLLKRPELTAEDYEVAEHFWVWLSENQAQRFIRACEQEAKERQSEEWRREHQQRRGDAPVTVTRVEAGSPT
jgi:hypothetical protein